MTLVTGWSSMTTPSLNDSQAKACNCTVDLKVLSLLEIPLGLTIRYAIKVTLFQNPSSPPVLVKHIEQQD